MDLLVAALAGGAVGAAVAGLARVPFQVRAHNRLVDEYDEELGIWVADESVRMLQHVRDLCKDRGVAALLVEHDVDGVFRTCDQITVLNLGTVLATGEPADVRANEDVVRAYLGSAA